MDERVEWFTVNGDKAKWMPWTFLDVQLYCVLGFQPFGFFSGLGVVHLVDYRRMFAGSVKMFCGSAVEVDDCCSAVLIRNYDELNKVGQVCPGCGVISELYFHIYNG